VIPLGQFTRLFAASANTALAMGLVIAPLVISSSTSRMMIAGNGQAIGRSPFKHE